MVRAKLTEKQKEKAKKEQKTRAEQSRAARRSGKSMKTEGKVTKSTSRKLTDPGCFVVFFLFYISWWLLLPLEIMAILFLLVDPLGLQATYWFHRRSVLGPGHTCPQIRDLSGPYLDLAGY